MIVIEEQMNAKKAHTHTYYIQDNDQSIGLLSIYQMFLMCNRVYRISLFVRKKRKEKDTGMNHKFIKILQTAVTCSCSS